MFPEEDDFLCNQCLHAAQIGVSRIKTLALLTGIIYQWYIILIATRLI